jgi:hypothetical protein
MSTTQCFATERQLCGTESRTAREDTSASFQDLPGLRISLDKLSAKLRSKFGTGRYQIFLMQDTYSIRAPGRLSMVRFIVVRTDMYCCLPQCKQKR